MNDDLVDVQRLAVPNFKKRFLSALVLIPAILWILYLGFPFTLFLGSLIILGIFYEWVSMAYGHKKLFFWGGAYLLGGSISLLYLLVFHKILFVALLLTTWATDTFAYMVGILVGGPKLAPAISPNKTWSGFGGGLVGGILFGFSFFLLFFAPHPLVNVFDYPAINEGYTRNVLGAVSHGEAFACVVVLVLVAQGGDLLESWWKRRLGVKDSGSLIPGHGGLLDRVDSLLAIGFLVSVLSILFYSLSFLVKSS